MLSLDVVRVSAAVALAATAIGFAVGLSRRGRPAPSSAGVTRRNPLKGTHEVWIVGVLVAFFWPVGIFLVPMYAYHWPAFPDFAYSWVVQVLGVVLGVSGGLLYSRSVRALGARMTPVIQVRRGDELVEEGPYRVVRHPMYIAVVMISLGQTLLCLSLPAAILTLILLGLAIYRAQLEEGLLGSTEGFGTAYATYATRTGMFLPTFRSPRKGRMDPRHPPRVKPTGGIP